jgi:hypothetical protein
VRMNTSWLNCLPGLTHVLLCESKDLLLISQGLISLFFDRRKA